MNTAELAVCEQVCSEWLQVLVQDERIWSDRDLSLEKLFSDYGRTFNYALAKLYLNVMLHAPRLLWIPPRLETSLSCPLSGPSLLPFLTALSRRRCCQVNVNCVACVLNVASLQLIDLFVYIYEIVCGFAVDVHRHGSDV